jgi:hypothetical protein
MCTVGGFCPYRSTSIANGSEANARHDSQGKSSCGRRDKRPERGDRPCVLIEEDRPARP